CGRDERCSIHLVCPIRERVEEDRSEAKRVPIARQGPGPRERFDQRIRGLGYRSREFEEPAHLRRSTRTVVLQRGVVEPGTEICSLLVREPVPGIPSVAKLRVLRGFEEWGHEDLVGTREGCAQRGETRRGGDRSHQGL